MLNVGDFFGFCIGNLTTEFFFEGHHEFDGIQAVGAEIVDERGFVRHFFFFNAKMFDDNLLNAGGNGLLLLNAVDALTLGNDLIEIRAKAYDQRVLEPVSDKARLAYRILVVGLVPVLIAVGAASRG